MGRLPKRVYYKHGAYYYVTPGRKWVRLGKSITDVYRAKLGAREGTMDALITRYLREVTPGKAPATQHQDRKRAVRLMQVFGAEAPERIKPRDVARYLRESPAKVAANRERALLSHIFTKAVEWGVVEMNPCLGIERNPEAPRTRYPEHAEVEAVGKHASPWLVRFLRLAYLTGQRPGDVLRLTPAGFTKDGLMFAQAKTGKRILVEWSPALRAAAQDAIAHGLFPYTWHGLASAWRRAVNKALAAGDLSAPFQLRDLRAKAGSDAASADLLGNTRAVAERHYLRLPKRVRPVI